VKHSTSLLSSSSSEDLELDVVEWVRGIVTLPLTACTFFSLVHSSVS
jgi:hypothetical protein